ncbi:MAG: ABC transporter permease, partial [Chloroflexota bacterium]
MSFDASTAPRTIAIAAPARRGASNPLQSAGTLARRKPVAALAVLVIATMVLMALLADVLSPHTPVQIFPEMRLAAAGTLAPDGARYHLGGDELGRDLLARTMHGARISLAVSVIAVGLGTLLGSLLGLLSGHFMGKLDLIVQRLQDVQQSVPSLLFAMMLVSILPQSIGVVILAVAITQIPRANRIVRGAVLTVKENAYIEASVASGASTPRVLFRHLLPNVFAQIIVIATTNLGSAMIVEASLGFLGFG